MIGNAGKKLQRMVDTAEELYEKVNQLRDQINELRGTVDETSERVSAIETEQAEQRALLDAIVEEHGLDVDRIVGDGTDEGETASAGTTSEGEETATADAPSSPANED